MTAIPSFTFMLPMSTTCLLAAQKRRAPRGRIWPAASDAAHRSNVWSCHDGLPSMARTFRVGFVPPGTSGLAQADQALIAYATVARSLPCPDVDRDGLQDCGAPAYPRDGCQRSPFAWRALTPEWTWGRLHYLVQRQGGANDLTMLTDTWTPLEYSDGADGFLPCAELLTQRTSSH